MSRNSTGEATSRVERLKLLIWTVVVILLIAPTVITCIVGIRFNSLRTTVEEMASQSPIALAISNKEAIDLATKILSELGAEIADATVRIQTLEQNQASNEGSNSETANLQQRLNTLEEEYAKLLEQLEALNKQIEETGASSLSYQEDIKNLTQ
ncbi:MAG: hypothetical protein IJC83_04105, partial [Oscillospiraceae bacterium]|nr:hypothetical protein [Oscillospiraceae bacterium]